MDYPFLTNKYTKWYMNIIIQARLDVNNRINGYFERHHIIPRSLDGNNSIDNLVKLTAREHFICHLLLVKMVIDHQRYKMAHAAHNMMYLKKDKIKRNFKINSRIYIFLKREHSIAMSFPKTEEHKENIRHSKLGIPRSEETKRKISISKTGVPRSAKAKESVRKGLIQRYLDHPVSDETKKKISVIHKGKVYGEETRRKIGAASRGRIQSGAKNWTLLSPTGVEHDVYCLKRFCIENDLTWKPLSNSQNGIPIIKGASKGWSVITRSK